MNIIEAIRSGRPFRRKDVHSIYMRSVDSDDLRQDDECEALFLRSVASDLRISLMPGDLLADDWEIQEPAVRITRTQFLEAFGQMYCRPPWSGNVVDTAFGIELARKLGLETP